MAIIEKEKTCKRHVKQITKTETEVIINDENDEENAQPENKTENEKEVQEQRED